MGRAGRWLKGFLGMKKGKHGNGGRVSNNNNNEGDCEDDHRKDKKRWSFSSASYKFPAAAIRSETESTERSRSYGRTVGERERSAAMKIQAVFRGFWDRKALKALKGIVTLQALIRGYMARKETAAALQAMQARAAARPRPRRSIERNEETAISFHSKSHFRVLKLNRDDLQHCDPYLPSTARVSPFYRSFTSCCDPITPPRRLYGEWHTALEKHVFPDYPSYMASTQSFQAKSRSRSVTKLVEAAMDRASRDHGRREQCDWHQNVKHSF